MDPGAHLRFALGDAGKAGAHQRLAAELAGADRGSGLGRAQLIGFIHGVEPQFFSFSRAASSASTSA